jgi:hypothetical protein
VTCDFAASQSSQYYELATYYRNWNGLNHTQYVVFSPMQLPSRMGKGMKRFFFNLCGACVVDDALGICFDTESQAFKAAQRMASELARVRPSLRGRAWIALTREGSEEAYCIAIRAAKPAGRRRSISQRYRYLRSGPLAPNPAEEAAVSPPGRAASGAHPPGRR